MTGMGRPERMSQTKGIANAKALCEEKEVGAAAAMEESGWGRVGEKMQDRCQKNRDWNASLGAEGCVTLRRSFSLSASVPLPWKWE